MRPIAFIVDALYTNAALPYAAVDLTFITKFNDDASMQKLSKIQHIFGIMVSMGLLHRDLHF